MLRTHKDNDRRRGGRDLRGTGSLRSRGLMPAFVVVSALLATCLVAGPSVADDAVEVPDVPDPGVSVPGKAAGRLAPTGIPSSPKVTRPPSALPVGGSELVAVTGANAKNHGAGLVDVGGLPLGIQQAKSSPGTDPTDLKVEVHPVSADQDGGVLVALTAAGTEEVEGRASNDEAAESTDVVDLTIDYSQLTGRYGGSYGNRLTVVQVPDCALESPRKASCVAQSDVGAVNRTDEDILVAKGVTVAAEGSPTVLMVTGAVSGESGSFGASSLSPSNTWSTDLRSGSFAWNYPLSAPEVPGSFTPNLGIAYSSGGIDGRTSSTNNQASQVGDGFELWPGFIERKYKSCGLDEVKNDAGRPIGDLCWDYDNAFISFNGVAGELVPSGTDTWRLQKDDGTKIERLRSTARGNSDNDGEYWKVTAPNGTQYFFGYNRLPGWESGDAVTASTWTVPVVGDDAGDECHAATRKASLCRQAWRWNLDYAVDAAGNKITYHYAAERNQYGQLGDPATDNVYHRGGTLTRIDYGLRGADLVGASAAQPLGRVSFTSAERCLASGGVQCTNIATQPSGWFDTPWDLNCNAGATCDEGRTSPSFWTRKMLTKITTQVFADTGAGAAWQNVDSWTLGHRWGIADSDYQLLLTSITRTGHTGTTAIAMPAVTFGYDEMANRMDNDGDGQEPFYKSRVTTIADEVGGQVDVTYSPEACSPSALPSPQTNTTRCFPQMRKPRPNLDPVTDWFNKYVVTEVVTTDRTETSPDQVTRYEYLGGGAWHFDESTGMVPEEEKTWSDWRGYGQVRTTTGSSTQQLTQSDAWFLRGMPGQKAKLASDEGAEIADAEQYAGFTYKTANYSAPGGAIVSRTVNRPWWHQTAISERSWGDLRSGFSGTSHTKSWTSLGTDGAPWRTTEKYQSYDTVAGRITKVEAPQV